jgi:rhomboid protease GluP
MPLLNLYRGKLKPDEVHPSARQSDTEQYSGQICEADFYVGEWHIARGNTGAAKPLIAHAVAACPKTFIEYFAAQEEASRLGLPLPKEVQP